MMLSPFLCILATPCTIRRSLRRSACGSGRDHVEAAPSNYEKYAAELESFERGDSKFDEDVSISQSVKAAVHSTTDASFLGEVLDSMIEELNVKNLQSDSSPGQLNFTKHFQEKFNAYQVCANEICGKLKSIAEKPLAGLLARVTTGQGRALEELVELATEARKEAANAHRERDHALLERNRASAELSQARAKIRSVERQLAVALDDEQMPCSWTRMKTWM